MVNRKLKIFFKLHWIKILLFTGLALILASLVFLIIIGMQEWGNIDAVSKQRTIASFPLQFYIAMITVFFFGVMWLVTGRGAGGFGSLGSKPGRAPVKGAEIGVHWYDVIGLDEAKVEAKEVVRLIRDRAQLAQSGGKILKGVLFFGPPGCGKTYLVKAIATETELPFLETSGSEFTERYVGVGASNVRKLFKRARDLASLEGGCIIFIDEMDAIGGKRREERGGGGQTEYNQTLNQLLVEIDGLKSKSDNIVVFGATNMPEQFLDEAILRPGRFDRKIVVDHPDVDDRKKLFDYYLSKVTYDKSSVNLDHLARSTVGSSPAEIANIVHEAAVISQRNKKAAIGLADINEARIRTSLGIKRKFKMTPEEKSRLAFYEAGHILVTYLLVPTKDVFKATIIPRGKDIVSALLTEKEEVLSRDKNLLLAEIRISLAGYACEKIKFGVTSDTAENDLRKATELTHSMIWRWGMGKSGHIGNFEGAGVSHLIQEDLDRDVEETMENCFQELNNLLRDNWKIADRLASELIAKDELDYDQIETIFKEFNKERPTKEAVAIQEKPVVNTGVTWDDVIGMAETKQEIQEVVELIRDRARLKKVGGKIIKGLMMFGPPGCGKTYLASAMATEFKLPFLYKSGSEFEQMYVGVGAMRVRRMFAEARELCQVHGGCIIFIDEIDAIGGKRAGGGGGDVETAGVRNQTINQLLTEMDGLKGKDAQYNLVVVGATNMPEDYFDPALMRPGRFDRKFYVYLPNLEDREKLFEYYFSKVQYDKGSVRIDKMARITAGYSPADISNLVHESAIICVRNKRDAITIQDVTEAMERIVLGMRRRVKQTPKEKEIVAYHEAGHAIITYLCQAKRDTFKLSIVPRQRTLGVSWSTAEESEELSRNDAVTEIMCSLGGYTAENIRFGSAGAGVSSDFKRVLSVATKMVYEWGMGASGFLGNFEALFLSRNSAGPFMSEETKARLDKDVQGIINSCARQTAEILTRERALMDKLAAELLQKQELDYDQIEEIFKSFAKTRPALD